MRTFNLFTFERISDSIRHIPHHVVVIVKSC